MIRIIAKLVAVTAVLAAFLLVAPKFAAANSLITYVSSTGSDGGACTAALPCATLTFALQATSNSGQVNCLNPQYGALEGSLAFTTPFVVTIDCPGVAQPTNGLPLLTFAGTNDVVKIRNLTISGAAGGYPAISFMGSGTLILENCVFENFNGPGPAPALDIEPNGPLTLVIKNSRVSSGNAGILIRPAGGSVNATLDHVTIAQNAGGGFRADSSNGAITVDIVDSTISDNASNGFNVTSGTGTQNNTVNIIRTTIAKNGLLGIQSGGSNAAVLLNASTLDSNASGATDALNGGRIVSYGNNQIIGAPGSGFTGSASLQ
jgi:hypothetical protein